MLVSKINFNTYNNRYNQSRQIVNNDSYHSNINFKGTTEKIIQTVGKKNLEKILDPLKKALLGIMTVTVFTKIFKIPSARVKEAINNGELDTVGKKIDTTSPKVETFLETYAKEKEERKTNLITVTDFSSKYKISPERLKLAKETGELDFVDKKIVITSPKIEPFLKKVEQEKLDARNELFGKSDPKRMTKTALAELLGIDMNSVKWHIKKGRIVLNEDMTIDSTNERNRLFIDSFSKGDRFKEVEFTPDKYEKLQKQLGRLPIEYCIQKGLLVVREDGTISLKDDINIKFMEKIENKEITLSTYFATTSEFAKMAGFTSRNPIERAILTGEVVKIENLGIELDNPVNKKYLETQKAKRELEAQPNILTASQLARLLKMDPLSILYRTKNGVLVRDEYGFYDINKEPNKSFVQGLTNGSIKIRKSPDSSPRSDKKERKKDPNFISKQELAQKLGVDPTAFTVHILKGHLHNTKRKGFDLNDPVNIHFINTFKKGSKFVALGEEVSETKTSKEETQSKKGDFNCVSRKEIGAMLLLTPTPILQHIERGRVVINEFDRIDLSDPKNIEFIETYDAKVKDRYEKMSDGELKLKIADFKQLLINRMSSKIFVTSEYLINNNDDEEDLIDYLNYQLKNIVDLDKLNDEQKECLVGIIYDIVWDAYETGDKPERNITESSGKLDIRTYRYLLDEMNKRGISYEADIEEGFVKENIKTPAEDSEIVIFENYLTRIRNLYSEDVKKIKKLKEKNKEDLLNKYLVNKFMTVKYNYELYRLQDMLAEKVITKGMTPAKAKNIVEKILLSEKEIKDDDIVYVNSNKGKVTKASLEELIDTIIDMYEKNLLDTVCTDRAYEMMKKANPDKNISKEEFIEYIRIALDIA